MMNIKLLTVAITVSTIGALSACASSVRQTLPAATEAPPAHGQATGRTGQAAVQSIISTAHNYDALDGSLYDLSVRISRAECMQNKGHYAQTEKVVSNINGSELSDKPIGNAVDILQGQADKIAQSNHDVAVARDLGVSVIGTNIRTQNTSDLGDQLALDTSSPKAEADFCGQNR